MLVLRRLTLHRGGSLTQSVTLHIMQKADISTSNVSFSDPSVYSKQTDQRQEAIQATVKYAGISGLDAAGAHSAELAGGLHRSFTGVDRFERVTALIRDINGMQMYFYRQSDGTFWERIHIPSFTAANAHLWQVNGDYIPITRAQFLSKTPPTTI